MEKLFGESLCNLLLEWGMFKHVQVIQERYCHISVWWPEREQLDMSSPGDEGVPDPSPTARSSTVYLLPHQNLSATTAHYKMQGKKKTPLEDYYVSAKLSLTKFDGKTHKLLNLELLVKIRLKMYRCEQSGTNDQGHTAAVERSAVPVSSWLGRGRRSRTPIWACWRDILRNYMCCVQRNKTTEHREGIKTEHRANEKSHTHIHTCQLLHGLPLPKLLEVAIFLNELHFLG